MATSNVTYKVEYQSKDGTRRFTHLVHSMPEALRISRMAREKGLKPKREKIITTIDYHIKTAVF